MMWSRDGGLHRNFECIYARSHVLQGIDAIVNTVKEVKASIWSSERHSLISIRHAILMSVNTDNKRFPQAFAYCRVHSLAVCIAAGSSSFHR